MRDTAGRATADAARCRNRRRGSFIACPFGHTAELCAPTKCLIVFGRLACRRHPLPPETSARPAGSYTVTLPVCAGVLKVGWRPVVALRFIRRSAASYLLLRGNGR